MSQFLVLFRGGDDEIAAMPADQQQAHMQRWGTWIGSLAERGVMKGAEPLQPTGRVISGTSRVVTDGPYPEGKEMVGGYVLVEAQTYEEASALMDGCPIFEFPTGTAEVREIGGM